MSAAKPRTTYFSNGQTLERPPLSVRVSRFINDAYGFLGLYAVSLFSLDPYAAAESSQFNIHRPNSSSGSRPLNGRTNYYGGGGGGSGGGGGPGSGSGRRIGRVDDVRGPECGSCR
ncbi:hypothetical protein N7532_009782 [Penicillium argentinense]|uniref:Uncharacterized protein n=1 Tax=Penicillium argentinense TaxID=1131581 RepID=A0A9W9ENF7_9EURO|nr:uncharacterized protein N7532_009782 [Penicillium argentinense]KAJ5085011.1 hypothetical protein N7532_009782 [Penicillium argentinense]